MGHDARIAALAVLAVLAALSACASSEPVIEVPAAGFAAMIVVFVSEAGEPSAAAIDLGGRAEPYVTFPAARATRGRLYALGYPCGLDRLGVPEGWLDVVATGRALPEVHTLVAADVVDGRASTFASASPAELAAVRIRGEAAPAPSPCLTLTGTSITLADGVEQQLRFVVGLDADRALFATVDGTFRILEGGVARDVTTLSTSTPHLGAFFGADGELWLAGAGGRVVRGELSSGLSELPPLASRSGRTQIWLDGPRSAGGSVELWAVTDERAFEVFDGTSWTILYQGTGELLGSRGGVAWLAPGEAMAVGPAGERLLHVRDGVVEEVTLPLEPGDVPTAIRFVEGIGVVVGSEAGVVAIRRDERWETIDTGARARIFSIAPLGDGFVFGGRGGVLTQYHPGAATCAPETHSSGNITFLVPLSDGLVAGAIATGAPDVVTTLRATAPPAADVCGAALRGAGPIGGAE
ncbi:hypothetical protein L6R52_21975 [Myxococcota bacterium]|nr:hypothetical protein [Myxococcota bacterium]